MFNRMSRVALRLHFAKVLAVIFIFGGGGLLYIGLRAERDLDSTKSNSKTVRIGEILATSPYSFELDLEEIFGVHEFGEPTASCGCTSIELCNSKKSSGRNTMLKGVISPRVEAGEFDLSVMIPEMDTRRKSFFSLRIKAAVVSPLDLPSRVVMSPGENSFKIELQNHVQSPVLFSIVSKAAGKFGNAGHNVEIGSEANESLTVRVENCLFEGDVNDLVFEIENLATKTSFFHKMQIVRTPM
jgi:hypothetical protein